MSSRGSLGGDATTPFSWKDALRALTHPGPPPRGWVWIASILPLLSLAGTVFLIWLGYVQYGKPHEYFGERDVGTLLSFFNFLGASAVSGMIARRIGAAPFARFWWIAAAGFFWLGLDEYLVLHERIDRGIHRLFGLDPKNRVTDYLDDAIIGLYGLAAVALAYRYRSDLVRLRWMALTLAVAFLGYVVMFVVDVMHWSGTFEDALKTVVGTLIVVGLLAGYLETPPPR